jgi:hypothetical protein
MTQRLLTEDEQSELDTLNASVKEAIEKRRAWLDVKMVETSDLKVGDDIYNISKGIKVGVVTSLYRYWNNRNDLLDNNYRCSYEYRTSPNSIDNTSRQFDRFGTKDEALKNAEIAMTILKGNYDPHNYHPQV